MTYTFKLSRRLALAQYCGMLALLFFGAACADNDLLRNTDGDIAASDQAVQVEVAPQSVFAEVNQRIQLQARGRLPTRASVPVAVEWTASGGTVSADGVFSAASPGRYRVVGHGRGGKHGDTTTVIVGDSVPHVVALVLSPDTARLQPSQTLQLTAEGKLKDGSSVQVGTVWLARGGTIDASGNYLAGSALGRYRVIATNVSGSLADTATVDIASGVLSLPAWELTPATVSLAPGASQQFAVSRRLTDGSVTAAEAAYTATGGTITSFGLFTAGSTPGSYRVIAVSPVGEADTSAVTVTGAFTGTVIYPGTDIQAAVDANPAGTAFLLKAGLHRMQRVSPKNGNVFAGEPGTILSGARELTTFARSGNSWVVGGQTQQGRPTEPRRCQSGKEGCQWPEDLFVDDRLLLRVTSLAQVGPGTWYFDYGADRIYLGDDPTGRTVETGVTEFAFGGTASGVTIRGLTVEKYAAPAQAAAIQGDDATRWLLEDVTVRQNHGIGVRIGDGWVVRSAKIYANGQMGMGKGGMGSLVENSEIYGNKTVPFNVGFAGGALKFTNSQNLIFRKNIVRDNFGNGIWLDIDNVDYLIEDNTVTNNDAQGIFIEISYAGRVLNNRVRGNGFERGSSWLYGAGILIAASSDVEVAGNEVTNNANGIAAIQQNRGSGRYGPHQVTNLYVHDNVVTMTQGRSGLAVSIGDQSYYTSRNNRWVRNTYILGPNAKYFAWGGTTMSEAEWRRSGQDAEGNFQR